MSRHKAYALNPRDCLKTTLFQKWQKMVAPPGKMRKNVQILPRAACYCLYDCIMSSIYNPGMSF